MFTSANDFNQCLSTWAEKTSNTVNIFYMLYDTACPLLSPEGTSDPEVGPWCQGAADQCGSNAPSNCIDDPDVKLKGKTCKKFLSKKRNKKCKRKIDDVLVADSCPSFCKRFCPPCTNKSGKIILDNGKKLNCKKIKKKKLCNSTTKAGPLAKEFCPVACNFEGC